MKSAPFTAIIPARLASTRLPEKVLLPIAGKPMIRHVYERACESGAERVIVAVDDQRIADAVASLIANTPDPGCVPDVMAAAVKVDRPYDLRDAVLARLARVMDRPEDVPEPLLQLQRAFQAAQRAVDAKGGAAGDPDPPANPFVGRYYTETLRAWIGGLLAGHREGMLDMLRCIIQERFGEWMTLAASIVLDERIDGPRAGVLASVLLEVSDPMGVLSWTEEVASMGDEELRQIASQGPPSGDDPVPWPWPPRGPPSADN